ncbi:MAG: hypothetical protein R3C32_01235 [Chloroflexota bacterium]
MTSQTMRLTPTTPTPSTPPSHLRPIAQRHLLRMIWDRIGWNVALFIEHRGASSCSRS